MIKGSIVIYEEYEDLCNQLEETPLDRNDEWRKHYHLLIGA